MSYLALFWYCYDDHLAEIIGIPDIGHVPFAMWLGLWILTEFEYWGLKTRVSLRRTSPH